MVDRFFDLKRIEELFLLSVESGDCPNLELPTNGGGLMWKNVECKGGWRLQYNYVTGLSRILDEKDIRKAWGSPKVRVAQLRRKRCDMWKNLSARKWRYCRYSGRFYRLRSLVCYGVDYYAEGASEYEAMSKRK